MCSCTYSGWNINGIIACSINIHVHIQKYPMLIYGEQTFHLKVSMTLSGREFNKIIIIQVGGTLCIIDKNVWGGWVV